jgi:hypothetical protein
MHICIFIDEQAHAIRMPYFARQMNASRAIFLLVIYIHLGLDHQSHALALPPSRSKYESTLSIFSLKLQICFVVYE